MGATNHKSRKHALLSASGSSRWLNCTPSARLEEGFANSESVYAAEGTLAHEFAELMLRHINGELTLRKYNFRVKKLKKMALYSTEMDAEVEKYVEYVLEQHSVAFNEFGYSDLLIEEKIDLTHYIPDGFGTNDSVIIADDVAEVIDLKYGKGVVVYAKENSQLMLYGLGALREHELSYDIETIRLTIVQPRLNHVDSWDISADDLRKWGESIVKPKAKAADLGEGLQQAGPWCKWCRAKAKCATIAAHHLKLAKHEFKSPHLLTDDNILEVYKQQKELVDWAKSVSDYVLKEALKGKKWNGFKLVEGRSNRTITDKTKAAEILLDGGYTADKFMVSKFTTLSALEKLVGKQELTTLLAGVLVKPKGKPTLVDNNDKRPEYEDDSAVDDFS